MAFYREKVFPLLAGALWLIFLVMDVAGQDSVQVKFAAICLCMAAAWISCSTRDGGIVAAALTLTVWADVFLLVLDRGMGDRLAGVSIFTAVQLLYAFRLYLLRGKRFSRIGLPLRLAALAAVLLAAGPSVGLLPLEALSLFYFFNLCVNTVQAFCLKASKPVGLFPWGLLLFMGCDLCVGAWNLRLLGELTRIGMWLFYLPSQVLIVLSQETHPAFKS